MNTDQRYMAAAVRLARRHEGLTAMNPSVACLIVRDDGTGPTIIASGITAIGGRPHAEPIALAEAGELAEGATAYVTLEPCAHHGRTPPCAQTLIDAGIARVVTAIIDPDDRVNNKGHAMLRAAGIEVDGDIRADQAITGLHAYRIQKYKNRAQVTVKLAVSADGNLGTRGAGQVAITGEIARAQSHLLRATHHAILVGVGTVEEDDPELTCRLPGLEARSPVRIVLDPRGRISPKAKLVKAARTWRTILVIGPDVDMAKRAALIEAGCEIMPCETLAETGRIALPELLDDLSARGVQSVLVEGGAMTAAAFLEERLADRIVHFEGAAKIASKHAIRSPLTEADLEDFRVVEQLTLGEDRMTDYIRPINA